MNFTLQLDSVPYTTKPKGREIGTLKTRLSEQPPTAFTLESFAEKVTQGYSFTPAVLMGGSKAENWQYQQVFGIDIDNEDKTVKGTHDKTRAADPLTVERVLDRCNEWGIKPALIYETFSSTPEWQKFRVLFIGGTAITDKQQAVNILKSLMEIFPECDQSCKNLDRLFFGGKNILHMDNAAVLTGEKITSLERMGVTALKPPARIPNIRDNQLKGLIQNFDFLGYIRNYFPGTEHIVGNRIQINPCPICGHNDDFWYYENEKTFYCFGANGCVGGSIIDFVMHTQKVDYKEAVKYFKYVLCGLNENRDKADFHEKKMIERHNLAAPIGEQVEELPPYIFEKVNERTGEITYHVSCPLLADWFREHNSYFWLRSRGGIKPLRYLYRNGVYVCVSDEEIKGILKDYISVFEKTLVKMRDVDEAFKNLCCDNVIRSAEELDADENVINFQNGILHLDTMELTEHTPDLLSTVQIPCSWNPFAASTPVFDNFMRDLTGGNAEVIKLLTEYMGVCISNVNGSRAKKALFLVGKGNTGKSRPRLLMEKLIGAEYCSSVNISDLEERFGTSSLYGKRLVGAPDMSAMNVRELKMFKSITGGDSIPVEFKGRDCFQYSYKGLLWFGANEMPKFGGDKGDHVYERMIIVRCDNVIPEENRDSAIVDKMYFEREGIITLLVNALRDFIQRGYRFVIPEICQIENQKYKAENSSVMMFYNECCCERKTSRDHCTAPILYKVFQAWAKASGEYAPNKQGFWKELADNLTGGDKDKLLKKYDGIYYPTFTITVETKTIFREAYGYDNTQS